METARQHPRPDGHAMRLRTSDGVDIAATHEPASSWSTELAVVVAHGFTHRGTSDAVRRVVDVLRRRAGVVTLDLRGHGESGGASTIGDLEVHDVEAAVQWARQAGYARVATLGFSLGGAVVVRHAGTFRDVDAVAAVSAPSRWYYRGTKPTKRLHRALGWPLGPAVLERFYGTRVARRHWDVRHPETWCPEPRAVVGAIAPVPLLVVHGDSDPYFPLDHAHDLADAAGEPVELWVEQGYAHAENAAPPQLLERISGWISTAVGVPCQG
ncbi:alpha/beta hydrolase family protein [Motilibacter peucedani]|uniref:Alpha/beta hydrolase family protein n=2 Tax=Motilibacter peucedani TaxID=598650 RepID=A0A420XTB0_9ACTN|nr:alpha/beta hydrolase family protein [Motilibacter peucedani]